MTSYTRQNVVRNSDLQMGKAGTCSVSPSIYSKELLQLLLILYVPQCEKSLKQSRSGAL